MQGSSLDWSSLLSECRDALDRSPSPSFDEIQAAFVVHFPDVAQVVRDYLAFLRAEEGREEQQSGDDALVAPVKESAQMSENAKSRILSLRNALRFCVSCISLGGSKYEGNADSSIRCRIQEEAVIGYKLHKALAQVLSQQGVDSKSRLLASRLLSNLVTANGITSQAVTKDIALSPTESYRTEQLLSTMSLSRNETGSQSLDSMELNWVHMISSAARAGDRGSVAAIVATLYNSMVAIQDERDGNNAQTTAMPTSIASDRILMSTFMRHILPVDAISAFADNDKGQTGDDATEWISLLVTRVSSYGYFPDMYRATGVYSTGIVFAGDSSGNLAPIITPEQIVLLHCVGNSSEEWATNPSADAKAFPLGGALGQQAIISSCEFLAEQASAYRQSFRSASDIEAYEGEKDCRMSAYLSILEMLANILSSDDTKKSKDHAFCRIYLGRETSLLSDTILDLGALVDKLSITNRGAKARELNIGNEDQRLAVVLVRLIGNISYKCVSNQDLVRETHVPFSQEIPVSSNGSDAVRSGLHILLSCTSFSYGCFTLREWALVAIRNVLDENKQNQDVVARLEAQKTVDTPELDKLGVKTIIDERGKIRVEPRD